MPSCIRILGYMRYFVGEVEGGEVVGQTRGSFDLLIEGVASRFMYKETLRPGPVT